MASLDYTTCFRYTILVKNPQYMTFTVNYVIKSNLSLSVTATDHISYIIKSNLSLSLSVTATDHISYTWVGVKNFGFTEKQKNIEQGSTKLKELHVCIMRVQKKMAA